MISQILLFQNLFYMQMTLNCIFKGSDFGEIKIFIESELRKIVIWFRANKLQISAPKSKYMLVIPQRSKYIPDFSLAFNLNDDGENDPSKIVPLKRISEMCGDKPEDKSIRMLGFFLDERLKLNYHSEILSKKLSKATFALNRNKHFLPTKIMKMLYYSLFDCHLNYCSIILSAASYAVLIRPILLQKRAVRIVKCADFRAHTADIFKELNILPFQALIEFNVICFMNNNRKNRLPPIFSNYFPLNHSVRHINYILRNVNDHHVFRVRYEYLKYFHSLYWNNFSCYYKRSLFYQNLIHC